MAFIITEALRETVAWLRDLVKYLITTAPYPIKMLFWILIFLAMSTLVNIVFTFSNVCTTDGVLYQPDGFGSAISIQYQRIKLSDNLNYTIVNSTFEPVEINFTTQLWESIKYFWTYGDGACVYEGKTFLACDTDNPVWVQKAEYFINQQAQEYNLAVEENGILKDDSDSVVGVTCDHENTHITFVGIDMMNKELWVVLTVILILFPVLIYALNKRR